MFTNKIFYVLLIGFIIVLLVYNSAVSITASNIYGLIPAFIEIVLLTLIFTKNRYVKLTIIAWAILSFIVSCGFELIANLMDDFNNDFRTFKINAFVYNIIGLIVGIIIINYTRRTVILLPSNTDSDQTKLEK